MRRRAVSDWLLAVWTALMVLFLFAPIATAVVYSFNKGVDSRQTATFTGFTTRWFSAALSNQALTSAVGVSLRIGLAVAAVSTGLGIAAGLSMARHPSAWLRGTLQMLVYLLLIVPEVVLGVSLLLFYTKLHQDLTIYTLMAAHTPSSIAIVALIVRSRVVALDRAAEDSAADLGAKPLRALVDIVLPQLQSAILASVVLAFTFSFDDVVISSFLTTPTVNTLPVYLFGTLNYGTEPNVYAAVTMLLGFNLAVLGGGGLLYWLVNRRLLRNDDSQAAYVA